MTTDETAPNTAGPTSRDAWWAGVLGAAFALAFGELLALNSSIISLVLGIGSVIVENTPGDLIASSINNLGSLQKPLLLGGITVASLLVGGSLGRAGRTNPMIVLSGFTFFGIVGGLATARDPLADAAGSWAVALSAAALGAAITLVILQMARRPETATITPGTPMTQVADRRRFLAFSGAAVGTAAVFAGSKLGGTSAAERARDEVIANRALTTTTSTTTPVVERVVFDSLEGMSPVITPISPKDEFYLIDTAFPRPKVDPANWSLTIGGPYAERELTFTYDDLLARDHVTREVTLSCVSNPVGGDLVDNAIWKGVPLTELLEEAGVDPTANTQIFSRSVDGWTCGFPTPLAYDGRTALLALEMNDEPLPLIHGFPARLVIAGLYGYVSATKWIESIEVTDWEGVDGFWMPRGWSKEGPVKTQSRIDVPRHDAKIVAGPMTFGGVAWAPAIGIERVDVLFDQAGDWQQAELAEAETNESWVQWKLDWDATPGEHIVQVRATDKAGTTQSPIPVNPAPNGAEGWHTIRVNVT
ncbi:MAG: molybdopterin-dependent oxidoreductase [Acidimicrobiales bacterium]|nr:molybdopterin-dependent oxidoreductase [Acidimicrobiales bacterium]RZV45745.1 MAG: molybdopterin-binding oxidoreductase [Acidimicrobiales bacterium]